MFSNQKKRFFKQKGFYIALVALLAFGWWMNQPDDVKEGPDLATDAVKKVSDEEKRTDARKEAPPEGRNDEEEEEPQQKNEVNSDGNEYYLVKEIDGIIKVFHYDQEGEESLLKDTDIAFSLISESDQAMFSEGVVINTEDELLNLLQDFES